MASFAAIEVTPRKRKRLHPHNHTITSDGSSRIQWTGCAQDVDIEDLHGAQCQLVCAPILPSQKPEEYPLSRTYAPPHPSTTLEESSSSSQQSGTWMLSGYGSSRARMRDSEFHFASTTKINPRIPDGLLGSTAAPTAAAAAAQLSIDNKNCPAFPPPFDNHAQPDTLNSLDDSRSQCLLERVNPEYFAQDKYRWHSSTAQGPDTSEMMSIDPESAQDFTALYTADNNISNQEMSNFTMPSTSVPEGNVPDLDGASSPSKSVFSSPDSMLQGLPSFGRQASETASLELDAFEDVNQMFDWDGASAPLVDDYIPDYKLSGPLMPRTSQYNTSIFRSIPTISARPYSGSGQTIYQASHRMIESSRASQAHMQHTMASQHADEDEGTGTVCHNCGVTKTPLWRRTPDKRHSLCNACGLYLKQYKQMRPLVPRNRSHVAKKDEENIVCTNCEATKTSLWRKDEGGQVICNACGLYFKLHGKARPVAMRKEKISRRKRYRNLTAEMIDIHDPINQMSAMSSPVLPQEPVMLQHQQQSQLQERQQEHMLAPALA